MGSWQSLDATLVAGSAVERVECIGAMIARADPRSPIPLARSARPRLGTMGQVGRSRNAQTADSRALRLRNPCREKVSPPVPVPASFQRSSHRHVDARDPQLHLPSTVYKQILPPFEAAGPRLHVDVDRPVTTASSGSPTIDPSRPGTRSSLRIRTKLCRTVPRVAAACAMLLARLHCAKLQHVFDETRRSRKICRKIFLKTTSFARFFLGFLSVFPSSFFFFFFSRFPIRSESPPLQPGIQHGTPCRRGVPQVGGRGERKRRRRARDRPRREKHRLLCFLQSRSRFLGIRRTGNCS